jgi:hypothetical protein
MKVGWNLHYYWSINIKTQNSKLRIWDNFLFIFSFYFRTTHNVGGIQIMLNNFSRHWEGEDRIPQTWCVVWTSSTKENVQKKGISEERKWDWDDGVSVEDKREYLSVFVTCGGDVWNHILATDYFRPF